MPAAFDHRLRSDKPARVVMSNRVCDDIADIPPIGWHGRDESGAAPIVASVGAQQAELAKGDFVLVQARYLQGFGFAPGAVAMEMQGP